VGTEKTACKPAATRTDQAATYLKDKEMKMKERCVAAACLLSNVGMPAGSNIFISFTHFVMSAFTYQC
jgi:hypothetical protein